jgi:hypothetical protein
MEKEKERVVNLLLYKRTKSNLPKAFSIVRLQYGTADYSHASSMGMDTRSGPQRERKKKEIKRIRKSKREKEEG